MATSNILTAQQIANHALSVLEKELFGKPAPEYYSKRRYGKWTIYNKDGWRVAHGLNEKQMKAYMKLLEEKE
jgi:hypothetical protein